MKKLICLIISIVMLLNVSGCQSENTGSNENGNNSSSNQNVQPLTEQEIISMSNYMNGQRTVSNGAWIYGISFNDDGEGVLSKIKDDGNELTILSRSYPSFINVVSGWIYYISYSWADESLTIKI